MTEQSNPDQTSAEAVDDNAIKEGHQIMYKKYYHKKLIRDGIVEIIEAKGGDFEAKTLSDKNFIQELKLKLVEESKELLSAPSNRLLNELADVLEVLKSIASYYHIPFGEIGKYQKKKRIDRGGFKKKLYLVWSTGKKDK